LRYNRLYLLITMSVLTLLPALLAATPAAAIWSTDPAQNLVIADRTGDQVVPKLAACPDGGCYVAWFDDATGGYRVYLQHLDAIGNELWPHNGILISSHPQSTSLVDWDLISDSQGHAVVAFTDTRNGNDLDIFAYRISPTGDFEWGPDGITLSSNNDFEANPTVCELTDGNFAFAWPRAPDTGVGAIDIQKVSPAGQVLFGSPIEILGGPNEDPIFSRIVAGDNGSFIVGYVHDSHFSRPRYLRAQKFSSAGAPLWGATPLSVYDAFALPIAYQPIVKSDHSGGAVFCWHRSDGSYYNSFLQHVDANGTERFPHNGVAVTTTVAQNNLDPTLAYDATTQASFIFWTAEPFNQDHWGISAQKIGSSGTRMWTDPGVVVVPISTIYVGLPRTVPIGGGAEVLYFIEPTGSTLLDQIVARRLNSLGGSVWGAQATLVSSTLSDKARLPVDIRSDGVTIGIWEDGQTGTADVYGQSLNPDGSLGVNPASVGGIVRSSLALQSRPNPFSGSTEILLPSMAKTEAVRVSVHDAAGRLVRTLIAPSGVTSVRWDGLDDRGTTLPAGTYFYRVWNGAAAGTAGRAVLTR
jgi:hypothetical protein